MKSMSRKIIICTFFVVALSCTSYGAVVIGNWENSPDGWIDWGNTLSIADPTNMPSKFDYEPTIGVTRDEWSLKLTKTGWNQNLSLQLDDNGLVDEFMANDKFSIDFSVAAATGGGYVEIYALSLNAQGYGWHDIGSKPAAHFDCWAGSPERTVTVTWDYGAAKASMPPMPSYVELIFATNAGGGQTTMYFDNAVLTPEPTTIALLGLGGLALRRRKR